MLLAENKLRLGRAQTTAIDPTSADTQSIIGVLSFLTEGLGLVTDAKMDQNPLESEFLFLTGRWRAVTISAYVQFWTDV